MLHCPPWPYILRDGRARLGREAVAMPDSVNVETCLRVLSISADLTTIMPVILAGSRRIVEALGYTIMPSATEIAANLRQLDAADAEDVKMEKLRQVYVQTLRDGGAWPALRAISLFPAPRFDQDTLQRWRNGYSLHASIKLIVLAPFAIQLRTIECEAVGWIEGRAACESGRQLYNIMKVYDNGIYEELEVEFKNVPFPVDYVAKLPATDQKYVIRLDVTGKACVGGPWAEPIVADVPFSGTVWLPVRG